MAGLDLTGNQISTTYKSLLKTTNNTVLPASGKTRITDGEGNDTSICLGRDNSGLKVYGSLDTTSDISSVGNISTDGTFTSKLGACVCGNSIIGEDNNCYLVSCGDFFVGGTSSSRCITMDAATGDTNIKGTLNIGSNESDTSINLYVKGVTTVSGEIRSCRDVVAYSTSDRNLKCNLNKICNTQNIISGLSGYSFDWNGKSGKKGSDLGLIAQDVQEVLPTIVHERDDGHLAIDYIKLIPVMVEEIKRLNSEVNELKNKIK